MQLSGYAQEYNGATARRFNKTRHVQAAIARFHDSPYIGEFVDPDGQGKFSV